MEWTHYPVIRCYLYVLLSKSSFTLFYSCFLDILSRHVMCYSVLLPYHLYRYARAICVLAELNRYPWYNLCEIPGSQMFTM